MKAIQEICEADFEREVLKSRQPVLVSFWAEWSQSCQRLRPVLEEVAARCDGKARVVKVNADDHPVLGLWYDIRFIPTLLCFVSGTVCVRIIGTASKEAILSKLEPFLPGARIGADPAAQGSSPR